MIDFRLNVSSGVPTYVQIVQQVQQAIRLGLLQPGDQLPTVKTVVVQLAINPNTVLKAYNELESEGLVEGRRGQGTFVSNRFPPVAALRNDALHDALTRWIAQAREEGLTEDEIVALMVDTTRVVFARRIA
ncbi:GntR family transcriptional regulator [soil metagenome]